MRETQVLSSGGEDPLQNEMATHSSTLAWKSPWMEEPRRLQFTGSQSRTQLSNLTSQLLQKSINMLAKSQKDVESKI